MAKTPSLGTDDRRCPVCGGPLVDTNSRKGVVGTAFLQDANDLTATACIQINWLAASPDASIKKSLSVDTRDDPRATPSPPRIRQLAKPGSPLASGADYQLLSPLGRGGMGEVYAARQLALDRTVAIKQLPEFGVTAKDRHRFRAEARITSGLDHPNIIPVYDLGEDADGCPFFAMKLVQGRVWGTCLHQFSEAENLEILLKVCDGIAFAHAKGVIHSDLKPDNVMLGEFGEVLVMDWGLATHLEDLRRHDPADRLVFGTPAYLAPEMAQADHARIGTASDIYLLGGCLYEMLTHEAPHFGRDIRECLEHASANHLSLPLPPGDLADIARRALATKPENRHPSVQVFQKELRDYLSHAESGRLSQRAGMTLLAAKKTERHEDYGRAIAGHEQALILWPDNRHAQAGLLEARIAFAQHAIRTGDLELAASLAEGLHGGQPDQEEAITTQITEALRARRSTRARLRLLGRTAVVASILLVVVSVAAAILAHNERQAVVAAIRERDEAELRLASLEHRGWESVIAENFNGNRLPDTIRPLLGRWTVDDRRLTARGSETSLAGVAASAANPLRLVFDLEHGGSLDIHLGVERDGLPVHLGTGGITISITEDDCVVRRGPVKLATAVLPGLIRSLARHVVVEAREDALEILIDGRSVIPRLDGLGRRHDGNSGILLEAQPGTSLDNLRMDRFSPQNRG